MTLNVAWLFVPEDAGLPGFYTQQLSKVYREWSVEKKMSSELHAVDVRGEWSEWLEMIGHSDVHSLQPWSAENHL